MIITNVETPNIQRESPEANVQTGTQPEEAELLVHQAEQQLLIHLSRQQRRAIARRVAEQVAKNEFPLAPRWFRRAFGRSVQNEL